MRWPDAEKWLADLIMEDGISSALHAPGDFKDRLPFVHVGLVPAAGIPGNDQGGSLGRPSIHMTSRIQMDCYAQGRDAARDTAFRVVEIVTGRPVRTPHGLLDEVSVPDGGGPLPGDPEDDTVSLYHVTVVAQSRPIR